MRRGRGGSWRKSHGGVRPCVGVPALAGAFRRPPEGGTPTQTNHFGGGTTFNTASTSRPFTRTFGCFGSGAIVAESLSFTSPGGVVTGSASLNVNAVSVA